MLHQTWPDNNLYLAQIITHKKVFSLFWPPKNVLKYLCSQCFFEHQPNVAQKWAPKITFHILQNTGYKKHFVARNKERKTRKQKITKNKEKKEGKRREQETDRERASEKREGKKAREKQREILTNKQKWPF